MQSLLQSSSRFEAGRVAEVLLVAELAGGRTVLRRQRVGYPFHITRAFQLDQVRPDLATLYLQSASGGLYAADRLTLDLVVGAGAALNLTTQASTVVHDGRGIGSKMRHAITVKDEAFCAVISDPYVLFPGADLQLVTVATVATNSVLIVADGFAAHDPHGRGATFARLSTDTSIVRPDGKPVIFDRGNVRGEDLRSGCGAVGGMAAAGSPLMICPPGQLPDVAEVGEAG